MNHEFRSCFVLRSSNLNSDPIHFRNQDSLIPRKFTSNLRVWKGEFFLLSAILIKIMFMYFLRKNQVLPTAAFHCFALPGLHGGSLMSSYCQKFESSCRAAEMKSFGKESMTSRRWSPGIEVGVFVTQVCQVRWTCLLHRYR